MLFQLVDSLGHRLPIVGAELLGPINQTGPDDRGRCAEDHVAAVAGAAVATTATSVIATVVVATTITITANVARNLGVGADRKQPIIATTRSDRIVIAVGATAASAATTATAAATRTSTGRSSSAATSSEGWCRSG